MSDVPFAGALPLVVVEDIMERVRVRNATTHRRELLKTEICWY